MRNYLGPCRLTRGGMEPAKSHSEIGERRRRTQSNQERRNGRMDKRSEWRMNKRTSGSILLTAAALALPAGATAAEGLSYGFIEIDYINLDIDEPEEMLDRDFDNGGGWGIHGSLPLGESFYAFASYS